MKWLLLVALISSFGMADDEADKAERKRIKKLRRLREQQALVQMINGYTEPGPTVDQTCYNNCLTKNYAAGLCQKRCSY